MAIEFEHKTSTGLMGRRMGGAGKPTIDVQRLGKAIRGPGLDTRTWLVSGTVGVRDDRGTFKTDDPDAVFVDRLGVVASVRIEPNGQMINARWNGIACGRFGVILFPLKPGDDVTVAIPDGDLNSDSISIIDVQSDRTAQIPVDWNNDRVLFDLNVAFEIRAPSVRIRSSNLELNGRRVAFGPEPI